MLGVYFFGSSLGGGVLTPVLGWMIDRWSFRRSFLLVGSVLLVLTVVCAAVYEGMRQIGPVPPAV